MTYLARSCPCCDGADFEAYPALVSSFIASYVLGSPPPPTRLLECRACSFRFFEDRLTPAEADRLYAGYRGDRYFRERHRHEPWYTRKVNDAIGGDDAVVAERRGALDRFVRAHVNIGAVDDVLDFGGDRGQLIPAIGQRRFVYEISGVRPVDGVVNIASAEALRGRSFDLVLLCHVLEHCSEPTSVLAEVRSLMRTNGSMLYVELPYERVNLRWLGKRAPYRAYLGAIRRVRPALLALDLYSTLFRVRFETLPPLGFVRMHEHLNFFDERSLGRLLERSGFDAVTIEKRIVPSSFGPTAVLSAIARASE